MSYEIIQKIEIDEQNRVTYITGASNNVYPRTPSRWPCFEQEKYKNAKNYKEAVQIGLLHAYESGEFQPGRKNKYSQAIMTLLRMPEYNQFNWRLTGKEYEQANKNREERESDFNTLLLKAFNTKPPRDKYAISYTGYNGKLYMKYRRGARSCLFTSDKSKATVFTYEDEAERLKKSFMNGETYQIEKL